MADLAARGGPSMRPAVFELGFRHPRRALPSLWRCRPDRERREGKCSPSLACREALTDPALVLALSALRQANSSAPTWMNFTYVPDFVHLQPAALDRQVEADPVFSRRPPQAEQKRAR